MSYPFKVTLGVRQGSVLSPFLFAIFLDDLTDHRTNGRSDFIILYADDILLLSPSLCSLQNLFNKCEREITRLNMAINVNKSSCLRIGPRCDVICRNIVTHDEHLISWVDEVKYLGIHITNAQVFKCTFRPSDSKKHSTVR